MSHLRFSASILGCFLVLGLARIGAAQTPEKKQEEAVRKIQKLLSETQIDRKLLPAEMPLAKLLAAVEQQLPKEKRIALTIDKEAFGEKYAEVAATPVALPPSEMMGLRLVLGLAIAKVKVKADYRIDGDKIEITTPQRARYTAVHDTGGIAAMPGIDAAAILKTIIAFDSRFAELKGLPDHDSIQILNGRQLVVRAGAAKHEDIHQWIQSLRRSADLTVVMKARLYEVDDAFYQRLKKAKRISIEEAERIFLEGKQPARASLFDLLPKQKLILAGDDIKLLQLNLAGVEIKTGNGSQAVLLSRYDVITCLPSPDQVHLGLKNRQMILEGVSFRSRIEVSPDRRAIRVKLTENIAEIDEIQKLEGMPPVEPPKQIPAEVPFVRETAYTKQLEVPDGGDVLVPVHYRPRSVQEKNRWWVLTITARTVMEYEEQAIRRQHLESVLPLVVADVLKNPRLKTTREFYGTPGDKRFALIDSAAWTWPKEVPKVPGFQLTPAKREGSRLLAIRVEKGEGPVTVTLVDGIGKGEGPVTVTLLNAGGSANGPVIGGCTLRYNVRQTEDGPVIALAEPLDP